MTNKDKKILLASRFFSKADVKALTAQKNTVAIEDNELWPTGTNAAPSDKKENATVLEESIQP